MTNFTCQVTEGYRSACEDLPEYQNTGYCILHFAGDKDQDVFREALRNKFHHENYDFGGTVFLEDIAFHHPERPFEETIEFNGDVSFHGAVFHGSVFFTNVKFKGEYTNFATAKFCGAEANFMLAEFCKGFTNFTAARFSGNPTFSDAKFRGTVTDFDKTEFVGESADFSLAEFHGDYTYFVETKFWAERTSFVDTKIMSGRTYFIDAEFRGVHTDFSKATFSGTTFSGREPSFQGTTFGSKEVAFDEATFTGKVAFVGTKENAIFSSGSSIRFDHCQIDTPELLTFNALQLRPHWFINADVSKVDFTNVRWYGIPGGSEGTLEEEIKETEKRDVESAHILLAQAYRGLSTNAEANREYPLANEFHYWSLEALRKAGWRRLGLIGTFYWALTGYGVRPVRAFWILFAIWLMFAVLYFLLVESSPFWVFSASDIWQGIDYARQAAVYSLSAMARLNPRPQSEDLNWFQTLVTIEGILGPLQIALLTLAVRRRLMGLVLPTS